MCDLVHNVEMYMAFVINYFQHLEIFSEISVMPLKLQNAVCRASLRFQERFPDAASI